jgi:RNA polymerase sigma-70 factor (ECF subfamily)
VPSACARLVIGAVIGVARSESQPGKASGPPEEGRPGREPLALEAERSLRQRLVARDEQALVELIEIASPWLLGMTRTMLADSDEAEEVVLEVFATAWDRIGRLGDEGGALMPWLLRITRNRAIDRLRRRRRWQVKHARAETFDALPVGRVGDELDESAKPGWHVHESVHAALAALPTEQREAVRLAYFQGLTHSEIARELGIPMGTVKTRLRLAFDKLRVSLASIKDWVL